MTKLSLLAILAGLVVSLPAVADDVSGLVRVSGSEISREVTITKPNEFSGTNVCAGDQATKMIRLESLIVKASGAVKPVAGVNGATCFDVASYKVLKTPAGRDALTGTLSQKGGVFQLLTDDGQTLVVSSPPTALQKLDGKKVVIDLKPSDAAGLTDVTYKAVYYRELP